MSKVVSVGSSELSRIEDHGGPESIRLRLVTEARRTFGERAAAQLWVKLDLPIVPAMLEGYGQRDLFDLRRP